MSDKPSLVETVETHLPGRVSSRLGAIINHAFTHPITNCTSESSGRRFSIVNSLEEARKGENRDTDLAIHPVTARRKSAGYARGSYLSRVLS